MEHPLGRYDEFLAAGRESKSSPEHTGDLLLIVAVFHDNCAAGELKTGDGYTLAIDKLAVNSIRDSSRCNIRPLGLRRWFHEPFPRGKVRNVCRPFRAANSGDARCIRRVWNATGGGELQFPLLDPCLRPFRGASRRHVTKRVP